MLSAFGCGNFGRSERALAKALAITLVLLPLASRTQTSAAAPAAPVTWPTKDGVYTIQNFRFGTGETLPQLRLHYLTLGTPHRDASGHVDNAVLLLHGTGGFAGNLLAPQFSTVLFEPGQPLD